MSEYHHPHSPSSMHRRMKCRYSGKIEPTLPNVGSAAASEGTQLHQSMELNDFSGLNAEQIAQCEWALECVANVFETYGRPLEIHDELKLDLIGNDGEVINNGTVDKVLVYDDFVVVLDYKFGYKWVSAYKNVQTWNYALPAMQKFDKDRAITGIIQPRVDNFATYEWEYSAESVDYFAQVIAECEDATPMDANPSKSACEYCKAKQHGVCPALNKANNDLAKIEVNDITAMTPEQCGDTLVKIDQVRDLMNGMEKQLLTRFEVEGDLNDYFEYKDEYKQGSVKFDELADHITMEALNVKGFTLTQAEFSDAYVNKNKKGVRGEVAGLREEAKDIYKKLKKGKAVKKGVKIVRL